MSIWLWRNNAIGTNCCTSGSGWLYISTSPSLCGCRPVVLVFWISSNLHIILKQFGFKIGSLVGVQLKWSVEFCICNSTGWGCWTWMEVHYRPSYCSYLFWRFAPWDQLTFASLGQSSAILSVSPFVIRYHWTFNGCWWNILQDLHWSCRLWWDILLWSWIHILACWGSLWWSMSTLLDGVWVHFLGLKLQVVSTQYENRCQLCLPAPCWCTWGMV